MSRKLIYISFDVEADGPIPGPFSMLQFGAAAFDPSQPDIEAARTPISTFKANLTLLPDAGQCPDTMAWWAKQGDAYENTHKDAQDPDVIMPAFLEWCRGLPGKPVLVGYPVTYDFMFLYWYSLMFGGLAVGQKPVFGFSGIDIKSIVSERLGIPYRNVGKRGMPRRWFKGAPQHTHDGLDDAVGQGVLFVNILRDRR